MPTEPNAGRNDDAVEAARKAWEAQREHFVAFVPLRLQHGFEDFAGATFSGIASVGWTLVSTAADAGFLFATFKRSG